MPYPQSVDTLTLVVDPFGPDTQVTLTVTGPGGVTASATPTSADSRHTWAANPQYTAAGKWVAHWHVTGTGAGETEQEIWVSNPASPSAASPWRPEPWNVAAYVPRRTLIGAVDGYGNPLNTFSADTHPPVQQVQLLITDACAWVAAAVATVDPSLYGLATTVASLYAAWAVELGYPDNRDDLSTAEQLLARATAMRADLDTANTAVTGTDPEDPAANLLPVYSFPPPVAWGDSLL